MPTTGKYCSVTNCKTRLEHGEEPSENSKRFFYFPRNIPLRLKWIEFCENPKCESSKTRRDKRFICEIHFPDEAFCSSQRLRLLRGAVPTFFRPSALLPEKQIREEHTYCSIPKETESNEDNMGRKEEPTVDTSEEVRVSEKTSQNNHSPFMINNLSLSDAIEKERVKISLASKNERVSVTKKDDCPSKSSGVKDVSQDSLAEHDYADDIPLIEDSSRDIAESDSMMDIKIFTPLMKSNKGLSNCKRKSSDDPGIPQEINDYKPKYIAKDFHFCGECQKVFNSFEDYLVHKLMEDKYNICFEPASIAPGLWIPKLKSKSEVGSEVEETDAESEPECENVNSLAEDTSFAPAHQEGLMFSCHLCGIDFENRQVLQEHKKQMHSARPYSCTKCNQSFKKKSFLVRHFFKVHEDKSPS